MMYALAFVPPEDVISSFELLQTMQFFEEKTEPSDVETDTQSLVDYFEDNYIGRLKRGGGRKKPRFDIALWNVYGSTVAGRSPTRMA